MIITDGNIVTIVIMKSNKNMQNVMIYHIKYVYEVVFMEKNEQNNEIYMLLNILLI